MDYLPRGLQGYRFGLVAIATLTAARGVDRFVLRPGAGTGWPLLAGIALLVALGFVGLRAALATEEPSTDHPW